MRNENIIEPLNPAMRASECYQQCFLSDNLGLMKTIESNTIDLIYCDILYGTGRNFGDYQDLKPIRSEIEAHYLPRLKEMHRVLKSTGSIYLQMDTRINHWLRKYKTNFKLKTKCQKVQNQMKIKPKTEISQNHCYVMF